MSENVTSLVVPEGDGGGGGGGRSLPNLIRHLGEFIRCALHRNGSPRPHPQPLPRAVYIARQKEAIFSDADQPQNIFVITLFIIKNTIIIIIIITRPKPAYGRQGLAGLWGQDTDQAGTFWGVVNISLRAFSAQLG